MKIPLELIRDHIKFPCVLSQQSTEKFRGWYQIIHYNSHVDFEEEFLLFGKAEDFGTGLLNRGIVSVGKPSPEILQNNDVLYFERENHNDFEQKNYNNYEQGDGNNNECKDVFHKIDLEIQKLFVKFRKWEDALREVMRREPSLDALFQLAADIFENSVFLHDENFYLLCSINEMPGQMSWEYDPVKKGYILPMDILNDFKVNQDYLDTMTTVGPSMFPADTFGYRILYQNLWDNGRYRGRICVNELGRKICISDYYLLSYFSQIVLESFRVDEIAVYKHTFSLSRFLICLIEKEAIDSATLDEILMQYGWTVRDEYFCACLFPEERDIRTNSIRYFCTRISNEFPHTCAFSYEKSIIILVNSTLSELTIPVFRNRMGIMLRESLMKAGISSISSDLTQFYYIYRQAVCALETGRRKQDTFWSYCFDEYQIDFIFQNALQEFPAQMLCSKEIFYLKSYDVDHTSDLTRTLKIYLENDRNLAQTSQLLGIHRSTLLYRIGRIKEITGLDMEDSRVRFRLWMSYCILDESGGNI